MPEPKIQEIGPLFEAFGAACYEAQHLEGSIRLLLLVIADSGNKSRQAYTNFNMSSDDSLRTLGDLFKAARNKEYFTDAEKKIINNSIKERNFLIHSYWNERILLALKPEGRDWIVSNLTEIRELIRKATSIINSLMNRYLEDYGANVEDFADATSEQWVSGLEPPQGLLH